MPKLNTEKVSNYKRFVVRDKIEEAKDIFTLIFDKNLKSLPGQFVMVWLPGIDEKPFSIGNDNPLELSIAKRGSFSSKLCELEVNQEVFVRGPYGNCFSINDIRANDLLVLVAGSYGLVPLRFLLNYIAKTKKDLFNDIEIVLIYGVRTKEFIMKNLPKSKKVNVVITTDDGSFGMKGRVTDALKDILEKNVHEYTNIHVMTCGNEKMSFAVAKLCENYKNVKLQMSLERIMKCAIGICGHCAIGSKLCCRDGTVFGIEILKENEFGRIWRELDGSETIL
ncbi:MAG: dihydroorotate dehydrogenase electron transfer subunit [Candidatus Micrarchaeota archaeon]|nr:dihydroorotate dehydrogenase electron transfer subunit [Candidatus Micrarchaeota archaeon]